MDMLFWAQFSRVIWFNLAITFLLQVLLYINFRNMYKYAITLMLLKLQEVQKNLPKSCLSELNPTSVFFYYFECLDNLKL